ncbi:MAG: TIGR00725 family protein [Deltaproteobacteria bacterium]|nr:TIGR00725 family protein [Deltaproteobacteria bacterium]
MNKIPVIGVIGANFADTEVLEIASAVGEAIADSGCHLVCGGKGGVMAAACRGFRFARNELNAVRVVAIGILPEDTSASANEFVDVVVPSGVGIARNAIITRMADGIVSVGGASGTLSELAFAWQMGKPIAAMVGSGGWSEKLAGCRIDDTRTDEVYAAQSAGDAVGFLLRRTGQSE